ncbi:MAG: sialidase family protein [Candidatus Sigynarchaeota archaeon]
MDSKKVLTKVKHFIQGLFLAIIFFLILAGSLFLWWAVRPSTYRVNDRLKFSSWVAVSNGRHNANTDLIYWNGYYYFIYANQPGNQGSTTTFLSLNRGTDLHTWTHIMDMRVPGEDIRDPKFAPINGQLFIYYLKNTGFIADPYGTAFVNSSDGLTWSEPRDVPNQQGWLFWRPKSIDNITWYTTGYWFEKGQCCLLSTTDGVNWTKVSQVTGASMTPGSDEAELVILNDKRILITIRVEVQKDSVFGDVNAGTGLAIAAPPYTSWNYTLEKVTRLDGPNLFRLNDTSNVTRYFALGRFQPDVDNMFTGTGSIFSRKRTSLFEFKNLSGKPSMMYISDLPSSGDTAYGGVIIQGDRIYMCYYTCDTTKDYAWALGMFLPSDIIMVNMSIASLFDAAAHPLSPEITVPWDNYIIVGANAGFVFVVIFWLVRKHSKR